MLCELYLHKAVIKNKIKVPGNNNISAFKLHLPDHPHLLLNHKTVFGPYGSENNGP